MKAYVSISYKRRRALDSELQAITATLTELKINSVVFVDNYNFKPADEKKMMSQAIADIDTCDILIAETSDKAIGIGIEVGYAKAKMKPIIYLRHESAEHSTTVAGISDFQIIYEDIPGLCKQLGDIISKIISPARHL